MKILAAALASAALLVPSSAATAAALPVDVKVTKQAPIQIAGPDFTQAAVTLTIKCTAPNPLIVLVNVQQGDFSGFGSLVGVVCDGKAHKRVTHVQSNFGTLFQPGDATISVSNNFNTDVTTGTIKIA